MGKPRMRWLHWKRNHIDHIEIPMHRAPAGVVKAMRPPGWRTCVQWYRANVSTAAHPSSVYMFGFVYTILGRAWLMTRFAFEPTCAFKSLELNDDRRNAIFCQIDCFVFIGFARAFTSGLCAVRRRLYAVHFAIHADKCRVLSDRYMHFQIFYIHGAHSLRHRMTTRRVNTFQLTDHTATPALW